MRVCPRCGNELAPTKRSDAIYCTIRCRDASKVNNPEVHRAANRRYYANHRDRKQAYWRRPDVVERQRQRWASASDEQKAQRAIAAREWLDANRDAVRQKAQERYQRHKSERLGARKCRLCGRDIAPTMKATAVHCSDTCAKSSSKIRLRTPPELVPLAEAIYMLKKEVANRG